jgi:hypothetical protein
MNIGLKEAKSNKADEFYTQYEDIDKELRYYQNKFANKVVFCNCDNPKYSQFWAYFHKNFQVLHLKRLIALYLDKNNQAILWDYIGGKDTDLEDATRVELHESGDFRSDTSKRIMAASDIIVTNPPFSLFREYILQLFEYNKDFLIIGNMNAITCKDVFPLLKNNQMWYGASIHSGDRKFTVPNDYELNAAGCGVDEQGNSYIKVKGVRWFTNLDYNKRHDALTLTKLYDVEYYPMYDNYAAINVNKYSEIPKDYTGIMGVPITFMDFYCPDQFEIIGISASWCETEEMRKLKLSDKYRHNPILKGKEMYRRIFIKRIKGTVE